MMRCLSQLDWSRVPPKSPGVPPDRDAMVTGPLGAGCPGGTVANTGAVPDEPRLTGASGAMVDDGDGVAADGPNGSAPAYWLPLTPGWR